MNLATEIAMDYGITIALVAISYLIGSISFGIITSKFYKIGNLRALGSGNIGATNVLRSGNKKAAAVTLFLDGGKGYLAILLAHSFMQIEFLPLVAIAVFFGHLFPVFHSFKGGKGVATFIGIMFGINIIVGLGICLVWVALAALFRKSSVSALGSSIFSPFLIFAFDGQQNLILTSILVLILWSRHKENIKRILSNTEPSITIKK